LLRGSRANGMVWPTCLPVWEGLEVSFLTLPGRSHSYLLAEIGRRLSLLKYIRYVLISFDQATRPCAVSTYVFRAIDTKKGALRAPTPPPPSVCNCLPVEIYDLLNEKICDSSLGKKH
jgi:hypothetical protein